MSNNLILVFLILSEMSGFDKVSMGSSLPHIGSQSIVPSWQDPYVKSELGTSSSAPQPTEGGAHRMVSIEGNKLRACALCSLYKIKTRSGWGVYTRHKCEACTVPLCKGKRDCFQQFHRVFGYRYDASKKGPAYVGQDLSSPAKSRIDQHSLDTSHVMPYLSRMDLYRQEPSDLSRTGPQQMEPGQ